MNAQVFSFYSLNSFISNINDAINPVGELSDFCETFARDVKKNPSTNGLLYTFNTSNVATEQEQFIDLALTNLSNKLDHVIIGLQTQDPTIANVTNLLGMSISNPSIGNLILNPVNSRQYPEFISFTYTFSGYDWDIKIWFCDDSFKVQYPKGIIEVVPPLDSMSILYNNWSSAKTLIQSFSFATMNNRLNQQIQNTTLTGTETIILKVLNVNDLSQYFDMPVTFAYNGGIVYCNLTNFLNTLVEYLITSTTITLNQWIFIIPGLIPVNRYYFIPDWLNISINNLSLQTPIYSPTLVPSRLDYIYDKFFNNILRSFYDNRINYTTFVYKSLGMFILPADNNPNGNISFKDYIHDYFVSPVGDVNIGQMSVQTQDFIVLFDKLIRFAELYQTTGTNITPTELSEVKRENRGNYVYLVIRVDNLEIAVVTYQSMKDNP